MNEDKLILLSGNPNVGKTTIFNLLTGLHQHTGNWTGKTVSTQIGRIKKDKKYVIVDLPGTYSLLSMSEEEIVARDAILFDKIYKNVIVVDSCLLERNLNLVLQILEINKNVIICLNLIDEMKENNIEINVQKLKEILKVPIVLCSGKKNIGIEELIESFENKEISNLSLNYGEKVENLIEEFIPLIGLDAIYEINKRFIALKLLEGDKSIVTSIYDRYGINILSKEVNDFLRYVNFEEIRKIISTKINDECLRITQEVVKYNNQDINRKSRKIDKILTSKYFGIPLSIVMLFIIFYITITLANYPSELLEMGFNFIEDNVFKLSLLLKIPNFIYEPIIFGIFKIIGCVISVMLPPMAIFFALFSIGEESGFLPRIAFNYDKVFKCCGCHGKQALTMCMGFGCNACGVVGSRIIDSPRDKIIAILTNNFIPCNGRFPLIISIITMFFVNKNSSLSNIKASLILLSLIFFSIFISLIVSKILSKTLLKGVPSHFTLELPSFRKPNIVNVIKRSFIDKTLFVLNRAIKIALPAGLIIWLFANININDLSILSIISNFINPFAILIGLDGIILLAFILALPANEIVLPIILMGYLNKGLISEINSLITLKTILVDNGWNIIRALSVCLFSLMHFPCATTLLTIKKEIGSKWMIYSFIIPLFTGIILLLILNTLF